MKQAGLVIYFILGLLLSGCMKDDVIPIAFSKASMPVSGIRMLVTDFADLRSDRRRLGIKHSFFGSEDMFQIKDETPEQAVAKALTQHLMRNGWPVEYIFSSADSPIGDVVISGTIVELSLDSVRGLFLTEIVARSKIAIEARNHRDGSAITYTVSGRGTYNVFWFEEQDAQDLMREVLESSFDKFVGATTVSAEGLRFRRPEEKASSNL